MKQRQVLMLDRKDSPWWNFLGEYFEETTAQIHFFYEPLKASVHLDTAPADLAFVQCEYLTLGLIQKLKFLQKSRPEFKLFHLGTVPKSNKDLVFDEVFLEPIQLSQFQKQLVQHLVLPEKIRVLLIDDEAEIVAMMRDYLENRTQPSFEIHHAENGLKGLEILEKEKFDVVVLDVKMPVMNGREAYREIKTRGINVPVIIFFDAIFGDEMVDIHQYGTPAVVEKGARTGAMPEMTSLIKKMVYFR
jgi:CheY-like chemotaxis protein